MKDFLTFELFITPQVLIVFYYLGVLILPFLFWKYKERVFSLFHTQTKKQLLLFAFALFFMLQLGWRMFFEMLIGYFDIHNYLQILSSQTNL